MADSNLNSNMQTDAPRGANVYDAGMQTNQSTRLDWVLYGIPVAEGKTPEAPELKAWLGAKLQVQVLTPYITAPKPRAGRTMCFITTVGVSAFFLLGRSFLSFFLLQGRLLL